MANHIDRSEQIKRGKFSIFSLDEDPDFVKWRDMIPEHSHNRETIIQQLKNAFMFKDKAMIEEIKNFISSAFEHQLTLEI